MNVCSKIYIAPQSISATLEQASIQLLEETKDDFQNGLTCSDVKAKKMNATKCLFIIVRHAKEKQRRDSLAVNKTRLADFFLVTLEANITNLFP